MEQDNNKIVVTITHKGVPKEYLGKLDEKLSTVILDILSNAGISADYYNLITEFKNGVTICGPNVWEYRNFQKT